MQCNTFCGTYYNTDKVSEYSDTATVPVNQFTCDTRAHSPPRLSIIMDAFKFTQVAQLVELACCPSNVEQTHTKCKCLLLAGFPCYRCHHSTPPGDKSVNRSAFKKGSKLNPPLCPDSQSRECGGPPYTPPTVDVLTQPARRLALALSFRQ
jgi:hypothetical protein